MNRCCCSLISTHSFSPFCVSLTVLLMVHCVCAYGFDCVNENTTHMLFLSSPRKSKHSQLCESFPVCSNDLCTLQPEQILYVADRYCKTLACVCSQLCMQRTCFAWVHGYMHKAGVCSGLPHLKSLVITKHNHKKQYHVLTLFCKS